MRDAKPLIGITANWKRVDEISGRVSLNDAYARSVHRAGGVAVLIPPGADAEALAAHLDGPSTRSITASRPTRRRC